EIAQIKSDKLNRRIEYAMDGARTAIHLFTNKLSARNDSQPYRTVECQIEGGGIERKAGKPNIPGFDKIDAFAFIVNDRTLVVHFHLQRSARRERLRRYQQKFLPVGVARIVGRLRLYYLHCLAVNGCARYLHFRGDF